MALGIRSLTYDSAVYRNAVYMLDEEWTRDEIIVSVSNQMLFQKSAHAVLKMTNSAFRISDVNVVWGYIFLFLVLERVDI